MEAIPAVSGGVVKRAYFHTRGISEAGSEDPPPILATWNRLYAVIIVFTVVLVLALYLMTITLNQ